MLSPECRQVLWPRRLFAHKPPQARDTPCSIFAPLLLEDKDMHHIPTITAFFCTWTKWFLWLSHLTTVARKMCFPPSWRQFHREAQWKGLHKEYPGGRKRCAPCISGKEGRGRGRQKSLLYERKLAPKNAHGSILFSLSGSRWQGDVGPYEQNWTEEIFFCLLVCLFYLCSRCKYLGTISMRFDAHEGSKLKVGRSESNCFVCILRFL